jgi:hypothetical protein
VQAYNESIIPVQEIIAIWHSDSATSLVMECGRERRNKQRKEETNNEV